MTIALCPEFTFAEALRSAEEDWKEDAEGKDEMTYSQFANALLSLADTWTAGSTADQYASYFVSLSQCHSYIQFLDKLFHKIAVEAQENVLFVFVFFLFLRLNS